MEVYKVFWEQLALIFIGILYLEYFGFPVTNVFIMK